MFRYGKAWIFFKILWHGGLVSVLVLLGKVRFVEVWFFKINKSTIMKNQMYVIREIDNDKNEPVYNSDGKIIAHFVGSKMSLKICQELYDSLDDEQKKKYVPCESEN